nr:hypothetical protein [Tanacetum cinerariifolium]
MNYQPIVAGNQPNDNAGIKENLDAGEVGKETVYAQQYVLLPLWSTGFLSGSDKSKKHDDKAKRDDRGKSLVDSPTGVKDLRAKFKEFSINNTNKVNAISAPETVDGLNPTNSTNSLNTASPSDTAISLNFEIARKSSFVDPFKYPYDPDMPELEDIVYSDDEEDVGAKADFSNLETNISVSPIPNTRVDKDHPVTKIISDLNSAPQTRSMTRMVKYQGGLHQINDEDFHTYVKSASTPIETEKPLLKDPDGEDVDVHIYRYLKGKLHLGLWYPKDSPFNLVAYSDSDYAGASLDRKSTTGGSMDSKSVAGLWYALVVNPAIYVSCIKQFWATATLKKVNDVVQIRALIDGNKVVVIEDVIRQDLHLDDADGVECLPNEEIFAKLARMRYEKPPPKLTFYKAFFSTQWKFLTHTLVQCVSAKRTTWNKFSYSMASAVICLATVDDLASHNTKYTSPALTQKVFANMRRVGKGFLGVETPLFALMLVQPQAAEEEDDVKTLIKMKAKKAKLLDEQIAKRLHDEEVKQAASREKQEKDDLERAQVIQKQYDDKEENIDWNAVAEQIQEKHLDNIRKYQKTQLQESFKKLKSIEVSGSDSTQETPTNDPKEMSEEDVQNMLEIVLVFKFKVEALQVKEDLVALWSLVKETFSTVVPSVDKEKALWVELKILFKPDTDDVLWKLQRTRIVEETLHITFLENKPNVVGSGPTWLFDIDTLTKSMNYKPVVAGNQSNGNAVLMKSGIQSVNATRKFFTKAALTINTARPINTVQPRTTVNNAGPIKNVINNAYSFARRPINNRTTSKNSKINKKVNTVRAKKVNTARPKAVLNDVQGNHVNAVKASTCWVWRPKHKVLDHVFKNNNASITFKRFDYGNPHQDLKDKGVIDNKCSRHMIGNISYLTDYEEINGRFVAFRGNSKGGKITGKGKIRTGKLDFEDVYFVKELKFNLFSVSQMCEKKNSVLFTDTACVVLSLDFKLTDESHVFLKDPRKDNMYSVDLKNVVHQGGLTCLFVKATSKESNLWHRRLGHVNFKTINKLVKGNIVRGLPSKLFEINETCVSCQKGKQHKASSNKDETSEILKTFITGIENLIDHRVKVIRCDNGTEFKNKVMNYFYEMKGIKREFSVARTPQQNGVAERKNRTLIKVARTMLDDSKLPTTFWAEAVNTACLVQNRVLVTKPHNKTPYKLFLGRKHALSFMRLFGCPVTILNTIDHLGKFDGKADEGFFVGYSNNSKAFRVFNSRTRIVEENLHVKFSENTLNIAKSGPNWLFDIDALTKSMNYKPVVAGNQSNGSVGTKTCDIVDKFRVETVPDKDYILLPLWTQVPLFSSSSKDSPGTGYKPSMEEEKKDAEDPGNEDNEAPSTEEPRVNQEKDSVNSTNRVNVVSLTVNAASNQVNVVGRNLRIELFDDPNMPKLEDISIFEYSNEDVFGADADLNNLKSTFQVSPIPITRIHRDRLKWVFKKKLDERGIVIRNEARFMAQGHTKEGGINYDEVFALVARIKAIRLFLAYASFKDFVVYQMDVKSAFLYGKIEEEVYVCQPLGFEDFDFPDKVYKVVMDCINP